MTRRTIALRILAGILLGLVLLRLVGSQLAGLIDLSARDGFDPAAQPHAVVGQATCNLGAIQRGPRVEVSFLVQNAGQRRLILHRSHGSCDCLAGGQTEVVVEPGKSRALVEQFDTSKASGLVRIETDYRTNDPRQPLLKLFVAADVVEE